MHQLDWIDMMISHSGNRLDRAYARRIAALPLVLVFTLIESSYTHFRVAFGWIKCDMRQAWTKYWDVDL